MRAKKYTGTLTSVATFRWVWSAAPVLRQPACLRDIVDRLEVVGEVEVLEEIDFEEGFEKKNHSICPFGTRNAVLGSPFR